MEKRLSIILLFIASFTFTSATLTPIYDKGDPRKIFTLGKPLILACNATDTTKITWLKENDNVDSIASLKGRYKIIKDEGKFIIERTQEEDAGNYSCSIGNSKHDFEAWAQVIVRVQENIYVVENEKLEITCVVRGTKASVRWEFSNSTEDDPPRQPFEEDERIKFEQNDKIDDSRIVIEQAAMSDRGKYYCVGTNAAMMDLHVPAAEFATMVRVKDKLAALWPFLGICAEVFVLCLIILIYEKRRNKTDLEESDTDQSPDQKDRK